MAIDLFGLAEADVRQRFPDVYQWVLETVKPERDVRPVERPMRISMPGSGGYLGKPGQI
jgi:hypothetical protein